MLGVADKKARLEPYDKEWAREAERTIERLKEAACPCFVKAEHVGSTAVRGIWAKPIIDIALAVSDFSLLDTDRMKRMGFELRPRTCNSEHLLFAVRDNERGRDTHYIHTVLPDSRLWREYVGFKDALNGDENLKNQYMSLKKELCEKYADDRIAYTEAKHSFIQRVLENIK